MVILGLLLQLLLFERTDGSEHSFPLKNTLLENPSPLGILNLGVSFFVNEIIDYCFLIILGSFYGLAASVSVTRQFQPLRPCMNMDCRFLKLPVANEISLPKFKFDRFEETINKLTLPQKMSFKNKNKHYGHHPSQKARVFGIACKRWPCIMQE